jgi:hypothetical protein
MARIVVGSPNLTQPLLLYPGLGPAMLEQHRRSSDIKQLKHTVNQINYFNYRMTMTLINQSKEDSCGYSLHKISNLSSSA